MTRRSTTAARRGQSTGGRAGTLRDGTGRRRSGEPGRDLGASGSSCDACATRLAASPRSSSLGLTALLRGRACSAGAGRAHEPVRRAEARPVPARRAGPAPPPDGHGATRPAPCPTRSSRRRSPTPRKQTGVDPSTITVDRPPSADRRWNNGALGCPKPGEMYTQALVAGLPDRPRGRRPASCDYHASRERHRQAVPRTPHRRAPGAERGPADVRPSLSTSSWTAAADCSNAARSSAVSVISKTRSHAARAEDDRHADEQAVDAELALRGAPRTAGRASGRAGSRRPSRTWTPRARRTPSRS